MGGGGENQTLTKTLGQFHPDGILNDLIACRSRFERFEAPNVGMKIPCNTSTEIQRMVAADLVGIFW